ncbi:MAG: hypothetical protein WA584_23640 [Pyrinomonadaceae bacterium]
MKIPILFLAILIFLFQMPDRVAKAGGLVAVRCHTYQTPSLQQANLRAKRWRGRGYSHVGVIRVIDNYSVVVGVEIFTLESKENLVEDDETAIICG